MVLDAAQIIASLARFGAMGLTLKAGGAAEALAGSRWFVPRFSTAGGADVVQLVAFTDVTFNELDKIQNGPGSLEDGYLILFDAIRLADVPSVASRSIVMNADRSTVLTSLERDRSLGAVENHLFLRRTKRAQENGTGLFGRKEAISQMGATLASGPFQSEHYGLAASQSYVDLPSLIVGYLDAHSVLRADHGIA